MFCEVLWDINRTIDTQSSAVWKKCRRLLGLLTFCEPRYWLWLIVELSDVESVLYGRCLTNDEEIYAAWRVRWISVDCWQQQQLRIDVESGYGRRGRNNLVGTFPGCQGGCGSLWIDLEVAGVDYLSVNQINFQSQTTAKGNFQLLLGVSGCFAQRDYRSALAIRDTALIYRCRTRLIIRPGLLQYLDKSTYEVSHTQECGTCTKNLHRIELCSIWCSSVFIYCAAPAQDLPGGPHPSVPSHPCFPSYSSPLHTRLVGCETAKKAYDLKSCCVSQEFPVLNACVLGLRVCYFCTLFSE